MERKFTALLGLFAVLVWIAIPLFAQDPAGSFSYVKGEVLIKADKGQDWKAAKAGTPFFPLDQIRTGEEGKAELMFKNGNIIWISSMSNMVIQNMESNKVDKTEKTKVKLMFGRVTNSVEKMFDEKSKFEVETDSAVAAVKGTKFFMDYSGEQDNTEVGVFEGSVLVDNKKGEQQVVEEGCFESREG